MLRYAIDSNTYGLFLATSSPTLRQIIQQADEIVMPFIVLGELEAGFQKGTQTTENNAKLEAFLDSDRVWIAFPDKETVSTYAKVWSELAKKGAKIPTNDLWIATLCLQYNCVLVTNDKHFDNIPLLKTLKID